MSDYAPSAIYFRCDAGREDGLGHLSRCLALAEPLAAGGGRRPAFITHAPDGVAEGIIGRRGHESVLSPARAGESGDLVFVRDRLGRARAKGERRPLLVIDSRRIGGDYVRRCGELAYVACLDDEALRDLPCDLLINGHVWATEASYPARAGRRVLAGPRYNLIPAAYFSTTPKREEPDRPLRVLVTLGGEDPHNHTAWVLRNLSDLLADHDVTLVLGPAHPDGAGTKLLAHRLLPRAAVVESPPSLAPFMAAADLAITAGGITCYELAAARVAQLAIVIEDHQRALVGALQSRGCLVALGSYHDLPRDGVRQVVQRFLESAGARGELAAAAATVFPDSGLARVSAAILQHYREGTEGPC